MRPTFDLWPLISTAAARRARIARTTAAARARLRAMCAARASACLDAGCGSPHVRGRALGPARAGLRLGGQHAAAAPGRRARWRAAAAGVDRPTAAAAGLAHRAPHLVGGSIRGGARAWPPASPWSRSPAGAPRAGAASEGRAGRRVLAQPLRGPTQPDDEPVGDGRPARRRRGPAGRARRAAPRASALRAACASASAPDCAVTRAAQRASSARSARSACARARALGRQRRLGLGRPPPLGRSQRGLRLRTGLRVALDVLAGRARGAAASSLARRASTSSRASRAAARTR